MLSPLLVLTHLLACTGTGSGPGSSDYALTITPVLPRNQGALLDELDSMDLVITQADGTETVLALSGLAEGDTSTFEELPPLDGAVLELKGYVGNDLAAIGRSEAQTWSTGEDEIRILVAAIDDIAELQPLGDGIAMGALAGDGSGGFFLFGGNGDGVYSSEPSNAIWEIDIAPPSDGLSFEQVADAQLPPLDNGDTGRICHAATLLTQGDHDKVGRILVTGGASYFMYKEGSSYTPQMDTVTWSAFLFDPDARTVSALPESQALVQPRCGHTSTELPSGDVVVAGGLGVGGQGSWPAQDTAEIFNPVIGGFEKVEGDPTGPLLFHGAAALGDDGVLVCGGLEEGTSGFKASDACDLITSSGAFTPAASLPEPLIHPAMASLPDGKVLLSGGVASGTSSYSLFDFPAEVSNATWIYDGSSWSAGDDMAVPRAMHELVALPGGDVLIVGGTREIGNFWNIVWGSADAVACVELYDAGTGRIKVVGGDCDPDAGLGALPDAVARPMVALDPRGVLIVGGLAQDEEGAKGVSLYVPAE